VRPRPSGAVALLVTSVVLTGLLVPGAAARAGGAAPGFGSGPGYAPGSGYGPGLAPASDTAVVNPADLPAEPPAQPARPPSDRLFGSDCDTRIRGSLVTVYCHNPYPRTDLVRLHVECERWWDVDGDGAAVPVGPAERVELTGRCWKEVRTAWVSHRPG
jgi:hypothetical protein